MTKSIEEIAGKHLGKTSDGATMQRYETPTEIDPSLLVGIPRSLNRSAYGITNETFHLSSYDFWNCYEFSFLNVNNVPHNGRLHIGYPAWSPNIVESKSLKLYLNSWNLARVTDDIDPELTIQRELARVLGVDAFHVIVKFEPADRIIKYPENMIADHVVKLERTIDLRKIKIDNLDHEDPNLLEYYDRGYSVDESFYSVSLRSNCRVTNQPDWGDVYINIRGDKSLSPVSLYKYIVSLRNENHFHEEIAECIFQRLKERLQPESLTVICLYTRRGGIDINPVRTTDVQALDVIAARLKNHEVIKYYFEYPLFRSPRQ